MHDSWISIIISSVKAREIVENRKTRARLFFALKKDAPYTLTGEDADIKITFPTKTALSDVKPQETLAVEKPPARISQKGPPTANHLKSVKATPLEGNITVEVKADRVIEDY